MNKAITDGLVLMPTPFAAGLGVWSSQDGTPGSNTYAGSGGGVFVPADQDFAGCMEIVKGAATQKVRYMGETPILPGCYLRVTARVKAVAGALPSVRIAGWPGGAGGNFVSGKVMIGPAKPLTTYGEVVEVSAIIGSGTRGGVDMVWDGGVLYGHLGLDFTGANGGVVRIDDIVIEDITSVFLRNMLAQVDVRDYGAKGNGTANDIAAFNAADAAANGREVLVPAGTYLIDGNMTFNARVRFEGTIVSPPGRLFILQKNFDFATYVEAFKNEETAFIKAFGALLNFADHESLDLQGRRIGLTQPVNMQAADPTKLTFATRRVIRNGQFQPIDGPAWNDTVVTSVGTYNASNPLTLTNVTNIANIPLGSLITGNGVGREVYVREVNVSQQRITLSNPLYDPAATQTYTFRRFKYLLDFSGFDDLGKFVIENIEFQGNGTASGVMLSRQGITNQFSDCFFTKPKDRAITSIGSGCQGLMIDRCTFASNEQGLEVESRVTVGLNANANDVKIRDSLAYMFRHFAVLSGSGSIISGNHWFHGDETPNGVRKGGLIITTVDPKSVIVGNYIDNNFIEWTNEHDATPAQGGDFSFGGLSITGNIFTVNDVAPWFNWIVLKPYGTGHSIDGLAVVGNVFRSLNGAITRVEHVDATFADLNYGLMKNVVFSGNTFNGVSEEVRNPASLTHTQSTNDRIWVVDSAPWLPFKGRARTVESVVPVGRIEKAGGQAIYEAPYVEVLQGATQRQFRVIFDTPCNGTIRAVVRMDNPL